MAGGKRFIRVDEELLTELRRRYPVFRYIDSDSQLVTTVIKIFLEFHREINHLLSESRGQRRSREE